MPSLATVECYLRKWKKTVSTSQIISCPLAKLSSFFEKCSPSIPIMISTIRKLTLIKKHVSTSRMNDFLRYTFPLFETVVWETERSWFPLARKSVTLVKIYSFLKNWLSLISVTVSTRRKNLWTKERVSTNQKIRFD